LYLKKTRIFDPAEGFWPIADAAEITDATVAKRGNRWWMYLADQRKGDESIHLFSASLPEDAPLSAASWRLTAVRDNDAKVEILAGKRQAGSWELGGGRHCPSYVKGWDPQRGVWVERIYYAGAAETPWGPYKFGYLEWHDFEWVAQSEPVFVANKEWERGSVYEPNLIYDEGKWKMWYIAGSNLDDYLVHGYAESADGRTGWTQHKQFAPPEEKIFDFCVFKGRSGYEAVFSRVWLAKTPAPSATGLWWCRAERPSSDRSDWSEPVQIMTAENHGWHSGPWKPSVQYSGPDSVQLFVFFDGVYTRNEPGGFPYAFTLGCLELERPG
jgi:hypothetical protein